MLKYRQHCFKLHHLKKQVRIATHPGSEGIHDVFYYKFVGLI